MKNHLYSLPSQDNYCQKIFGSGSENMLNGQEHKTLQAFENNHKMFYHQKKNNWSL